MPCPRLVLVFTLTLLPASAPVLAQPTATRRLSGVVSDATGAALPGVSVVASNAAGTVEATTDTAGRYQLAGLRDGRVVVAFRAVNFADATRTLMLAGADRPLDVALELALTAEVTVVASRTFRQLSEAVDPAASLLGIAHAASEGAVTGAEVAMRPVQRAGEVLEAVPGLVVSQHTGEGKANQYYLRGFNLDHGTDFATTVAGLPVNLPTHAHGHGYTDANFLIPELVGGIQYTKGGYDAASGDFSSAGTASVRYLNVLDRPIVSASSGGQGWARALAAVSHRAGPGDLLVAVERAADDGPWVRPDAYRRTNGVMRYSGRRGVQAFSLTALGYTGRWNGTDQVPARAVADGRLDRFGGIDQTTGGTTSRAALIGQWQLSGGRSVTSATASLQHVALDLFSNFTYFLDDPVNGDQFGAGRSPLAWRRRAPSAPGAARSAGRMAGRLRSAPRRDRAVGLYHTSARRRLATLREDAVDQDHGALFADAEIEWRPAPGGSRPGCATPSTSSTSRPDGPRTAARAPVG
ncbi:MAG: TonB-dependent receptor [Vicinamibacterales bacterium]